MSENIDTPSGLDVLERIGEIIGETFTDGEKQYAKKLNPNSSPKLFLHFRKGTIKNFRKILMKNYGGFNDRNMFMLDFETLLPEIPEEE